jgi:hypothetical protein
MREWEPLIGFIFIFVFISLCINPIICIYAVYTIIVVLLTIVLIKKEIIVEAFSNFYPKKIEPESEYEDIIASISRWSAWKKNNTQLLKDEMDGEILIPFMAHFLKSQKESDKITKKIAFGPYVISTLALFTAIYLVLIDQKTTITPDTAMGITAIVIIVIIVYLIGIYYMISD